MKYSFSIFALHTIILACFAQNPNQEESPEKKEMVKLHESMCQGLIGTTSQYRNQEDWQNLGVIIQNEMLILMRKEEFLIECGIRYMLIERFFNYCNYLHTCTKDESTIIKHLENIAIKPIFKKGDEIMTILNVMMETNSVVTANLDQRPSEIHFENKENCIKVARWANFLGKGTNMEEAKTNLERVKQYLLSPDDGGKNKNEKLNVEMPPESPNTQKKGGETRAHRGGHKHYGSSSHHAHYGSYGDHAHYGSYSHHYGNNRNQRRNQFDEMSDALFFYELGRMSANRCGGGSGTGCSGSGGQSVGGYGTVPSTDDTDAESCCCCCCSENCCTGCEDGCKPIGDCCQSCGNAIGDSCQSCGNAIGDCCCACGNAIGDCCQCCGNAIGDCCEGFGNCCCACCDGFGDCCGACCNGFGECCGACCEGCGSVDCGTCTIM